jgi:hypothetical protein
MASNCKVDQEELGQLIQEAKRIAKLYRDLTGKPLGIAGEVGEYEAARRLNLQLASAREPGYDAIRRGRGKKQRIQIKTRLLLPDSKPGQRCGGIKLDHEWDSVILVLLDQDFEPTAMYEAAREAIAAELTKPGSKARNERGALAVSKFKAIGKLVWPNGTQ